MKVAIMQPYIFPYLGYFQLIESVDYFVFFDDVNFIKKGWINRNKLLNKQQEFVFSIPLKKASQNRKINEHFVFEKDKWVNNFLKSFETFYSIAPNYKVIRDLINSTFEGSEENISELAILGIEQVYSYLEIPKNPILRSSELQYNREGKGVMKILSICSELNATEYINASGGRMLYDQDVFESKGVKLGFINSNLSEYKQGNSSNFFSGLSILDILVWNSKSAVVDMMGKYEISE